MAKSDLKTKKNKGSVSAYISAIRDPERKKDAEVVLKLMQAATGEKPVMWGSAIVGYGEYRYKRRDGSEHSFAITGFSSRKQNLTIYPPSGHAGLGPDMKKLGSYKHGKGCLYIKHLSDINLHILKNIITRGYKDMKKKAAKTMIFY